MLLEEVVQGSASGLAGGSLCRLGPQLPDRKPGRERRDALLIGHRVNKRYGLLTWPMDISLECLLLGVVCSLESRNS